MSSVLTALSAIQIGLDTMFILQRVSERTSPSPWWWLFILFYRSSPNVFKRGLEIGSAFLFQAAAFRLVVCGYLVLLWFNHQNEYCSELFFLIDDSMFQYSSTRGPRVAFYFKNRVGATFTFYFYSDSLPGLFLYDFGLHRANHVTLIHWNSYPVVSSLHLTSDCSENNSLNDLFLMDTLSSL